MTLIACAMTDNYVAMVADRRLIYLDGRLASDRENKLVFSEGNLVLGYTGLARIGSYPTDQWLCDQLTKLHNERLDDKLTKLAETLQNAIGHHALPAERRLLAILGIGFAKFGEEECLEPFFCLISNFHDGWKPHFVASKQMRLSWRRLPPNSNLASFSVGQRIPDSHEVTLRRRMERLSESSRLSNRTMIPILAEAIRQVAKLNTSVGNDLLACSIPRQSVKPGQFIMSAGTGNDDNPTFLYLPVGNHTGLHFGPIATACGMQIGEIKYGPAQRDGTVRIR